jgi:DNA modification methylase
MPETLPYVKGINAKEKDLIGIPWRVAFALQADGWYLRQDIIWHKPNPMPESVRDRCTKAHEYIFMLTKSARYYYDAIAEPLKSGDTRRPYGRGQVDERGNGHDRGGGQQRKQDQTGNRRYTGFNQRYFGSDKPYTGKSTKDYEAGGAQDASATKARIVERILSGEITTRNKRSVWTVTAKPFKGAHFAAFPPDLIEPCILAGSKPGDTVLDPFGGAGTTGLVAQRHGRNAVLIELNPDYVAIARERIEPADGTKTLFPDVVAA